MYLSEIEDKHFKFLDAEIQASLMDIEECLHAITVQLRNVRVGEEDFYESISSQIMKIMKEICNLDRLGIEVYSLTD